MNNKIKNLNLHSPNLKLQFKTVTSYYPFKTVSKLKKVWNRMRTPFEEQVRLVNKYCGKKSKAALKDLKEFGFISLEKEINLTKRKSKTFIINNKRPNRVSLVNL